MGYPTPIEWTDATWNPIGGCEIHSPGCINCYAQRLAGGPRLRGLPLYRGTTITVKGKSVFNGMLTVLADNHLTWTWPLRWRGCPTPRLGLDQPSLMFIGDMSDLFHARRPLEHIDRVVATSRASRHIAQLLTKRADVMADYFESLTLQIRLESIVGRLEDGWHAKLDPDRTWPARRLWLGFSAERQQEMDERAHHMRRLAEAGWQIFVSIEPLLGRVVLPGWFAHMPRKPWVIVGGESGPEAREVYPGWVREIRDQAAELGCPFFFKQWGEIAYEGQQDASGRQLVFPSDAEGFQRIGKTRAGRSLDGREHIAFPVAA